MTRQWKLLTASDEQVLSLLVQHGNDKTIARHLGIEPGTVRSRLHHIRERLEIPNRVVAAVEWDRHMREAVDNQEGRAN